MANTYKHTELFGGAITANIPAGFADVSTIRQVPDNQEVYLSTTGLTSLIFDLAERVAHPSPHEPDLEALKFHFEDIVHEGDMSNIIETKQINLPNFPAGTPALTLLATTVTPPSSRPNSDTSAKTTTLLLTLIRLAPQETDVVITVNIPHVEGESLDFTSSAEGPVDGGAANDGEEPGSFERLIEAGKRMRDEVVQSVRVRDWGLFG